VRGPAGCARAPGAPGGQAARLGTGALRPPGLASRRRAAASRAPFRTCNSQGWPRIFQLAQQFDWKSLTESSSWSKVWAKPVNFTFRLRLRAEAVEHRVDRARVVVQGLPRPETVSLTR
jgi:hypothetical protein